MRATLVTTLWFVKRAGLEQTRVATLLSMPATRHSIEEVIGANVRRRREQLGMVQEELARDVSLLGPRWTHVTVVRTESGQRSPSILELLALSTALALPLQDLLAGGDGRLEFRGGAFSIELADLRDNILNHEPVLPRSSLDFQRGADWWRAGLSAEEHAAKRIGRSTEDLREAASALWGRPFLAERDERLRDVLDEGRPDPETRRAQRGHVSRKLLTELRNYFEGRE